MSELISVIMSVYNETNIQLKQSIESILQQTYKNLEIIVINDNPNCKRITDFLGKLSDDRIIVLQNNKNEGLVYSLNRALHIAKGELIARMDADDISDLNRLEREYCFLNRNGLDFVGTWVKLIDEDSREIGELRFPISLKGIKHQIKLGGCVAHPTWLGKRNVFFALNGYRDISCCEDYDFLLRALKKGYKLGNLPYFGLSYRVRSKGISSSNKNKQIAIRRFLKRNSTCIDGISINDIEEYLYSNSYLKEIRSLEKYENQKAALREKNFFSLLQMFGNKNFYCYLKERCLSTLYKIIYK